MTIEGILLIIAAVGVVAVNIITAWRQETKIAAVEAKADVIVGHVNSAASVQVAKVDALTEQVAGLYERLAQRAAPKPTKRK